MATTINEVAREAGVSRSTVSLVLQNNARIPQSTQLHVRAAMARLGYRPSLLAAGLRNARSYLLGLVITDLSFPHYAPMAMGIEAAVREHGYSLLISNSHEEVEQERKNLESLRRYRADGLLIAPVQQAASQDVTTLAALQHEGFPFVCLNREVAGLEVDYCGSDHDAGIRRLIAHLVDDLGHTRIAMLSGTQLSSTSLARLTSWRDELHGRGLPAGDELVVRHAGDRAGGEEGMAELLSRGIAFTAVICTNDLIAVGAMRTLHRAGLRVPEDVSVTGFGGYESISPPEKPLTTITEDYREMGCQAGELLLKRIGGALGTEHRVVPTQLVVGQTTAFATAMHGRPSPAPISSDPLRSLLALSR